MTTGKHVFLVITKDVYFFNAVSSILTKFDVIHITSPDQICELQHKKAHVVIDAYNNNIFHSDLGKKIKHLVPLHAYIISPFSIKKCLGNTPTTFIDRDASIFEFFRLFERRHQIRYTKRITFSYKQHQILTLIMKELPGDDIAKKLCISRKTFYSHKYNIMLLLKLRKMCELVNLSIAQYLV